MFYNAFLLVAASTLAGDKPKIPAELQAKADRILAERPGSDPALMVKSILDGADLGPGDGWFGKPSLAKYDWPWLARRFEIKPEESLESDRFSGRPSWFSGLDRNGDGSIDASDFDWSERSPFLRQQQQAAAVFRAIDKDGDGKITAAEWDAALGSAASFSQESLRRRLFPPPLRPPMGKEVKPDPSAGEPTPATLLRGLFDGELGSFNEGPRIGDAAPDFELSTNAGRKFKLSSFRGKQPVVLIFGSFT
jgi:hypothetical protein